METLNSPGSEGSAEDTGGKKPGQLTPPDGSDKISPPEENLKELLKVAPDNLNLEDDEESLKDE